MRTPSLATTLRLALALECEPTDLLALFKGKDLARLLPNGRTVPLHSRTVRCTEIGAPFESCATRSVTPQGRDLAALTPGISELSARHVDRSLYKYSRPPACHDGGRRSSAVGRRRNGRGVPRFVGALLLAATISSPPRTWPRRADSAGGHSDRCNTAAAGGLLGGFHAALFERGAQLIVGTSRCSHSRNPDRRDGRGAGPRELQQTRHCDGVIAAAITRSGTPRTSRTMPTDSSSLIP
jgi:hypothetical protein